jgi:hypothetical protein
MSAVRPE